MDGQTDRVILAMVSSLIKRVFIPSIAILCLLAGYTYFARNNFATVLPPEVIESTETIDNVNNMRFSFKVTLLTHHAAILYAKAIARQDEHFINEAIDNIDAAIAFISLLNRDAESNQDIVEKLNKMKAAIADTTENNIIAIEQLVTEIHTITELRERQIWTHVQKQYVTHQYSDYRNEKTYQIVTAATAVTFVLLLVHLYKSSRLYRQLKSNEHQLEALAYQDRLTGLPNILTFEKELENYVERAHNLAVNGALALINIDDFKNINNAYGRHAGDEVIKNVASVISEAIGHLGSVSKLEGDEFAVIFPTPSEHKEIIKRVIRIHESLRPTFVVEGHEYKVTVSIGIANTLGNSVDPRSSVELFHNTDIALRRAKADGKNCFHTYTQEINIEHQTKQILLDELQQALNEEQFELYYQPIFSLSRHEITAVEALVRWNHPKKGKIKPKQFIEALNHSHMAIEFNEWVICRAIEQQHLWKSLNLDVAVSINLSLHLLTNIEFVEKLKLIVSSLNANLSQVYFEIADCRDFLSNSKMKIVLEELTNLGYQFVLDDFGSDSSSICVLAELPVSTIKIDVSNIHSIDQSNSEKLMLHGMLLLAKSRSLEVIAEGVETKVQADQLKALHCDYLQGRLLAKPQSEQSVTQLLTRYQNRQHNRAS